jgi:hypothetical protein
MKALLTAALLLSTLLFGTHQAVALPTSDPPGLGTPAAPPEPRPCATGPAPCDTAAPATHVRTAPTDSTNWWRVAVPVLALLALAAGGAFLLLVKRVELLVQRIERRPQRPLQRPQ